MIYLLSSFTLKLISSQYRRFKNYRKNKFYIPILPSQPARFPFRHQTNDAQGFFIQRRICALQHYRVCGIPLLIYYYLDDNTLPLFSLVMPQIFLDELHSNRHATGKLRHLLHYLINSLLIFLWSLHIISINHFRYRSFFSPFGFLIIVRQTKFCHHPDIFS